MTCPKSHSNTVQSHEENSAFLTPSYALPLGRNSVCVITSSLWKGTPSSNCYTKSRAKNIWFFVTVSPPTPREWYKKTNQLFVCVAS